MKKLLCLMLVLAALLAGCGNTATINARPVTAETPEILPTESPATTVISTPANATPQPTADSALADEQGAIHYKEKGAGYSVDVAIEGLANQAIRQIIQDAVNEHITAFRQQVLDWEFNPESLSECELFIANENHQTQGTFSCLLSIYAYYAGAAHGVTALEAHNFSLPDVLPIDLSQLFAEEDYLEYLSDVVPGYLYQQTQLEEGSVTSGLEPEKANFENFAIQQEGLRLYFEVYQVASYAEGEQQILIPWEDLSDVLAHSPTKE